MTSSVTKIEGIEKLVRDMRELSGDLKGNVLRKAARKMATPVRDAARAAAPRDEGRLTNAIQQRLVPLRLRDIATRKGDAVEIYEIFVRTGRSRDDPKGAFYWWFQENGTENLPAQPFLRPAFYSNEAKLPGFFADDLGKSLDLAARRRAKRL